MSTDMIATPTARFSKAARSLTQPLSFIKTKFYGAPGATVQSTTSVSSLVSSPISIKTAAELPLREAAKEHIYELSTINDSGVYLPPSLDTMNFKRDHWHTRPSSDNELFPSADRLVMRRSLSEGYDILNFHTPSVSSRPPVPIPTVEARRAKHMTWDGILDQNVQESSKSVDIETRRARSASPASEEDDETPPSLSGSVSSSTTSDPLSLLTMEEEDVRSGLFPRAAKAGHKAVRAFVPKFSKWDTTTINA
ncbi:hypothetical protein BC938DRAFT_475253 [Jimgerdemannia flammicorona]|uniref:Uncharacterized protein n=1 Tax=Jimgerdemannia flammicorona TaxID=994334 RepID=A0A433QRV9_9FUNG|nr:hypothetical protein BC938DRAFT_475253 [Jimgerdemannia flammicorona]